MRNAIKWYKTTLNANPSYFFDEIDFFFRFDCDSEGVICVDELKFILSNLPVKVSTQEIEEMIKAADIDGDGKIDFQEFRKMIGQ